MSMTILDIADRLRTEADAYLMLEEMRWHGRPLCPHCGSVGEHYFLNPSNGRSRKTRTGAASERRVWKCRDCRRQSSVLTGTVMHGSKVPIRIWLLMIFDASTAKNGISAREIERKYGLTPRTAWHLMHRIREAMKLEPIAGLLSGRVIADETWYGGKPSNRHGHVPRKGTAPRTDKTPIMSLVSRETGEVRSQVVADVTSYTLRSVLFAHTDRDATHLHTDSSRNYRPLSKAFASHSTVDHEAKEYVRDGITTNHAETYFSQLKRSLDGTHHHVSREHLHRYVSEFDYRFSTCRCSDIERMEMLIGKVGGRRLTYRSPTRHAESA
jgi:transposase-like protein